jgi:membrane-associated protease RseP (regulator of RpoE activity)
MSDPRFPIASTTIEYYRPDQVLDVPPPERPRYWIHGILLLATVLTTLVMGARMEFNFLHGLPAFYEAEGSLPMFPIAWALHGLNLMLGIPFSFTLMLILVAHEMGHYLYCRRYGVSATLPFFIPFPTIIGTLGAFIRIRSQIRSRSQLFDIGIAGPIAGFVVAVFVLAFGLGLSKVMTAPSPVLADSFLPNYPLIFSLVHRAMAGVGLSHGTAGLPLSRLLVHPTVIAAWVGMFATSLNLLPGGQLDGGHIVFSVTPRWHRTISRLTIIVLLPLAYYCWVGWLLWAVLLRLSGLRHPEVPEWPTITGGRLWLAVFAIIMLVLTFMPAPISNATLMDIIRQLRSQ